MFKRIALLTFVGLALAFGTGCTGKTADERDSLNKQNAELSAQLEAERKARADAEARAAAAANTPTSTDTVGTPSMGPTEIAPPTGAAPADKDFTRGKTKWGQDVIQIQGDFLFDSGKAALKPAAKKALDKVAAIIKKDYNGQLLRIEGHTDASPVAHSGWDDNWDLGSARARSVLLYLASKGVSEKHMYIASFAANEPKSTKNLALNRRVEIVVTQNGK